MRRHVGQPFSVGEIALAPRHVLDVLGVAEPELFEEAFEGVVVGSSQGAVLAFQPVRFPGPPSEPDVRLSPHRALHVFTPRVMRPPDLVSPTVREYLHSGSDNE